MNRLSRIVSSLVVSGVVAAAAPSARAGDGVGVDWILPRDASPARMSARRDAFGDLLPAGAVGRLGTIRFRHAGRADCLSFSPDGRMLVSSNGYHPQSWHSLNGGSYQAQFWDLTTGKLVRRISAESVHFLPGGSRIILCRDRQIRAWDVAAGKQLWSLPHQGKVQVSPDGTKVLAVPIDDANNPRGLRVLKASSAMELGNLEAPSVDEFAISPNGSLYAGTSIEHPERRPGADRQPPRSVVQIWNVESGEQIARIELAKVERHRICFSSDGRSLIIMEKNVIVDRQMCTLFHIWNVAEKREVAVHKVWGCFDALAVSPDGEKVVVASFDGQIDVRRYSDWKLIRKLVGHLNRSEAPALAFSPDGDTLAVSVPGGVTHLWDIESGLERFHDPQPRAPVKSASVSPDGNVVVTATDDGAVRLWDLRTGIEAVLVGEADPWLERVVFAPQGNLFAAQSRTRLKIWERMQTIPAVRPHTRIDVNLATSKGFRFSLQGIQFSPDGKQVWAFGQDGGRAWAVDSGKQQSSWKRGAPEADERAAVSPDLSTLAVRNHKSANDKSVQLELRDARTGKIKQTIEHPLSLGFIYAVSFSPTARLLACVTPHNLRVYDITAGNELFTLPIPGGGIYRTKVAFSRDGRLLAFTTVNGQLVLVEVASGGRVIGLQELHNPITSVDFSPDGRHLVTGHKNTTSLVWDLALAVEENADDADHTAGDVEELWTMLAEKSPPTGYRAVWRLANKGDKAIAMLSEKLRPARDKVDDKTRRSLIDQLDAEEFQAREEAARKLTQIGTPVLDELQRAIAATASIEVRNRARRIASKVKQRADAQRLRDLRAISTLEQIGSRNAHELLVELSKGAPLAEVRIRAREALDRLATRSELELHP